MIDFNQLWHYVTQNTRNNCNSFHGVRHWKRVEKNGLYLSQHTNADTDVVRLFALFHDCKRENEHHDPLHGKRAADYASELQGNLFELSDEKMQLLLEACELHNSEKYHADPTIATCWDADRLDLGRVNIIPNPHYLSTQFAKQVASDPELFQEMKAFRRNG